MDPNLLQLLSILNTSLALWLKKKKKSRWIFHVVALHYKNFSERHQVKEMCHTSRSSARKKGTNLLPHIFLSKVQGEKKTTQETLSSILLICLHCTYLEAIHKVIQYVPFHFPLFLKEAVHIFLTLLFFYVNFKLEILFQS